MKYGRFVKVLKEWVRDIDKDPKRYAAHSCRRGGATGLKMMGVSDSIILEAGRWRSESSMKLYFDWDVEIRVRVEKVRKAREKQQKGEEKLSGGLEYEGEEVMWRDEEGG